MRIRWVLPACVAALAGFSLFLAACVSGENPLAEYEGSRPLLIQRITESYRPGLQWVGGRVAAVGVNRGPVAALDETLVWIRRVDGDEIGAPVNIDGDFDKAAVTDVGGDPRDSLENAQVYTFWIATCEAVESGLSGSVVTDHTLADSTFELSYLLNGRSSGGVDVDFRVVRNETITDDSYTITWTPGIPFRQLAINESTLGGFTDLIWHVVLPDDHPDSITPPVVIGQAPEDALVATEWDGFGTGQHVFWATTSEWEGENFGFTTRGFGQFQMFAGNFQ